MRYLHSTHMLTFPPGIVTQLCWEQEAARDLGLDWNVYIFSWRGAESPETTRKSLPSRTSAHTSRDALRLRIDYFRWLRSRIPEVDVFLLRYSPHDPIQWHFMNTCPRPVYLVHHTLETHELASIGTHREKLKAGLEGIIGPLAVRKSRAVVAVTQEIAEYERRRAFQKSKTSILYPNGVRIDAEVIEDRRGSIPELLIVASEFHAWHGLDLLLSDIRKSTRNFRLHIIGEVSESDQRAGSEDRRIIFHGTKDRAEIREIGTSCWIGLSSFALHRKGMKEACTLKVREYLMLGLPVFAGYREVFPNSFPFFCEGPPSIHKILEYAHTMRNVHRREVRECALPFIEKSLILRTFERQLRLDLSTRT